VSTVNGGVIGMVRTMAVELAPIRVNAIHPGVIGDSPYWADKPEGILDPIAEHIPIGRLVDMRDLSRPPSSCSRTAASTASIWPPTAAGP
jgi:NAD(P)-dependent dehydrogenase (short-subunit alcohol dehydrogenase family)